MQEQKLEQADRLARKILEYARNTLFMNLQFMKNVLGRCNFVPYHGTIGTDAKNFYYHPNYILKKFEENPNHMTRTYLHMIMHCIFQHQFVSLYINRPLWNLACDIAVENMIQELKIDSMDKTSEAEQTEIISQLSKNVRYMTAEKIYEYLLRVRPSEREYTHMQELFAEDNHDVWYQPPSVMTELQNGQNASVPAESQELSDAEKEELQNGQNASVPAESQELSDAEKEELQKTWQKLSKQIQTDLETFSKQQGNSAGNMIQNLKAVNRENAIMKRFSENSLSVEKL